MVTTVCMNPAFDKTASIRALMIGDVNRLEDMRVDVGGKGINVAIVLRRLGVDVECVGCLGSENQSSFLHMLKKEELLFEYMSVPGEVRTNLKILDHSQGIITEFNEAGIVLSEHAIDSFLEILKEKAKASDWFVFSGALPLGCADNTYLRCMKSVRGTNCVLDTSGNALLMALEENPFLIKPNLPELEMLVGTELHTHRAIQSAARQLIDTGAQNVIVSMGQHGSMLINEKITLYAPAIDVVARSTVGAGDAMVGGIVAALSNGNDICEAFQNGVAAATASVMTEGTQLIRCSDFKKLLSSVTVQEI